jgi:PKD repeat protein
MLSSRVLSFIAGTALLAACGGSTGPSNSPPTADFTAPTCTVNVSCSFAGTGTDTDGTIASFAWDFGDQTAVVTGQNVTHTFATANTFQVKLTATDNAGATGTVTKAVTVSAAGQGPTASFTVACNSLDCSFTNTSTPTDGTLTYQWDFGEPTSGANNTSTAQNPTHTYTATAVTPFTITLTVTGTGGATATTTQTITVSPAAALTCDNGSGTFTPCTLDLTQKAIVTVTVDSTHCEFTGNTFAITQPIQQTLFTNGCKVTKGTVYTLNGPNADKSFDAPTSLQAQFTQGSGKPTDPPKGPPAIRVTGSFPDWTLAIDDGGNLGGVGEPDFTDIILSVHAATVP